MVTAVAEDVVPGPPVRLHEAEPFAAPQLRFEGLDAWRDHAPFAFTANCLLRNACGVPLEVVDGRATIPLLPGAVWNIEVRGKGGLLLLRRRASRGLETVVRLPEPVEVEVQVRDAAGAPIADAVVRSMPCYSAGGRDLRITAAEVGRTGADGVARVVLPSVNALTGRTGTQLVRVEHEGHATSLLTVPARGRRVASLVMEEGHAVRGRLVDAAGEPMVDVPVYLDHPVGLNGSGDSRFGAPLQGVRTDADGRFVEHGCSTQAGCRVLLVLSPTEARRFGLATAADRSLAPVLWVAARTTVDQEVDFGAIAMHEVRVCRLEVVGHDGVPATEARVRLLHDSGFDAVVDFVTDRVGRLQFTYPDESTRAGVFVRGGGVAVEPLAGSAERRRVTLSQTRQLRGTVVDDAGKPMRNAVVHVAGPPPGMSLDLRGLVRSSFGWSEPTAADGRYEITLPIADQPFTIRARWRPLVGDPLPKLSRLQKVAPDTDAIDLVVR
jgi:hypothetical protein